MYNQHNQWADDKAHAYRIDPNTNRICTIDDFPIIRNRKIYFRGCFNTNGSNPVLMTKQEINLLLPASAQDAYSCWKAER